MRGTSTLLLGAAGVGKSSLSSHFACSALERGESAAIYLFDESKSVYLERSHGLGVDFEPHIKSGKLRGLAVTTAARSDALPNLPTVGDFVSGYEAGGWNGIGAPEGTPLDVVDKLQTAVAAALADPKMQARLAELRIQCGGRR